jgi:hypothetical protein
MIDWPWCKADDLQQTQVIGEGICQTNEIGGEVRRFKVGETVLLSSWEGAGNECGFHQRA